MNKELAQTYMLSVGPFGIPARWRTITDGEYLQVLSTLYTEGFIKEFDWETEFGILMMAIIEEITREAAQNQD